MGAAKSSNAAKSSRSSDEICFESVEVDQDILFEVLLRVPAQDLVKSCVRVCKLWHSIISLRSFWKEKCFLDGLFSPLVCKHLTADEDFKVLYLKKPYERNLIKNPDASKGKVLFSILF